MRSFFTVADERARTFVEQALDAEVRLWPDFLLQVSPSYERVATVEDLAAAGNLHAETAKIFQTMDDKPYRLYKHQVEALERANAGASYVVGGRGPSPTSVPIDCRFSRH